MKTTKIVWNGCDSYIEADMAESRGYDFDGTYLFHGKDAFTSFEVKEVSKEQAESLDFDGVFGTETGKYYIEV